MPSVIASGTITLPAPKRLHNRVFDKIVGVFGSLSTPLFKSNAWRLVADNPKRLMHSIKVGIALVLVSLFYFVQRLFDSSGGMATWAIMTVVVIFEFTAGIHKTFIHTNTIPCINSI